MKRPGAAAASAAAVWASSAGPRVNAGTIAVPRRSRSLHWLARTSGVKASATFVSVDHASV